MLSMLIVWLISAEAIYMTATITPCFAIRGFGSAMIAAGLFKVWQPAVVL